MLVLEFSLIIKKASDLIRAVDRPCRKGINYCD